MGKKGVSHKVKFCGEKMVFGPLFGLGLVCIGIDRVMVLDKF